MPSPRFLTSPARCLLWAGLLLSTAAGWRSLAAQDSSAVRTTTVTYLAGTSIYVGAGRADGLVEGQ